MFVNRCLFRTNFNNEYMVIDRERENTKIEGEREHNQRRKDVVIVRKLPNILPFIKKICFIRRNITSVNGSSQREEKGQKIKNNT